MSKFPVNSTVLWLVVLDAVVVDIATEALTVISEISATATIITITTTSAARGGHGVLDHADPNDHHFADDLRTEAL